MKKDCLECMREMISEVVETELTQAALAGVNLFGTMERLLRSYPRLKRLVEDYELVPRGHSKDISVAPPPGMGVRDVDDVREELERVRRVSYARTLGQLESLERFIARFDDNPYFPIVRMYCFGEDLNGERVVTDNGQRTIEEIAAELDAAGFAYGKSEKTVGRRKNELIQDMVVLLYGNAGAISIEKFKAEKRRRGEQQ